MKIKTLCLLIALALSACTDNGLLIHSNGKEYVTSDVNGIYKIGDPYQVNGITYRPQENYNYKEVGIASWYGPDFHKGLTANGETYNMHVMSAAHRTLPLPSVVKVTNLENGKTVVVRVNDRGPFVNNRIIDLSKSAADKLGFLDSGTAKVKVEIMADESKALKKKILAAGGKVVGGAPLTEAKTDESVDSQTPPAQAVNLLAPQPQGTPAPQAVAMSDVNAAFASTGLGDEEDEVLFSPQKARARADEGDSALSNAPSANAPATGEGGRFYVQGGAFSNYDNALAVQKKLSEFGSTKIQKVSSAGNTIYRVRIGPYQTGEASVAVMDIIEQSGYTDLRLIEEK